MRFALAPLSIAILAGAVDAFSWSYHVAYDDIGSARILLFAGLALASVATFTFVATEAGGREGLAYCLCLFGALSMPKLLRAPSQFAFNDELQHVRSTADLLRGAPLFTANPINPPIAHYPGLHVLTSAVASIGDLTLFAAGNSVIVLSRLMLAVALYVFYLRVLESVRLAVLAVAVYAANPAFLFFDAQFSYETLALPLVVSALALASHVDISRRGWTRFGLLVYAAMLMLVAVPTHHVSVYAIAIIFAALGITVVIGALRLPTLRRDARRLGLLLLSFAFLATVASVTWSTTVATDTGRYLGHDVRANINAVSGFFGGQGFTRAPFSGSPFRVPAYVRAISYGGVLAASAAYAGGLYLARSFVSTHRYLVGCALIGGLYFVSLPVQLLQSSSATPIVQRIWEFAFIGLAPIAALALDASYSSRRPFRRVLAVGVLATMLCGGPLVRAGENILFPGPYISESGPNAATPDVFAAADWLRRTYGLHQPVMAEAEISQIFAAYANTDPITYQNFGYKPWLVFYGVRLSKVAREELDRSGTRFIIVDTRMLSSSPFTGYYFSTHEPRHPWSVFPVDWLAKFNNRALFSRVYDNGNIRIFEYLDSRPIGAA